MRFQTIAPPPVYVDTPERIRQAVQHCAASPLLGVDTETLGLLKDENGRKYHNMTDLVVVMGLSPDEESRYLVPQKHIPQFKSVLEDVNIPKALTNVKFDAHRILNTSGVMLDGPWADTVCLDFLLDEDTRENRHGLKPCVMDYFGISLREYKDLFGTIDPRQLQPGHELWEKYLDYSSLDPWLTRKLAVFLMGELGKIRVWDAHDPSALSEADRNYTLLDQYWETEEPQLKTLWRMERVGIRVSRNRLGEIEKSLTEEMNKTARELNKIARRPVNPASGPQLGKLLFEDLGLPNAGKTPTGQWVTTAEVLKGLALGEHQSQEAALALDYKKAMKLRGTYAVGLAEWIHTDGRIHTSYSPTKTTGRLGSNDPNLQNLPTERRDPHRIRAAFIPEDGNVFIVADYSQLEMRLMAFIASTYGDDTMKDAINGGLDMHSFTAARMMGVTYEEFLRLKEAKDPQALVMRSAAKSIGFGILYGSTEYGLSATLSRELKRYVTPEEAREYITMYLRTFPGVHWYMQDTKKFARKHGYVQTLCGRFRRLSQATGPAGAAQRHAERQAINAPVQGSAADIVKRAMIICDGDPNLQELGFRLLHQIHDELIFEGPSENAQEALNMIKSYMEHPLSQDLTVRLVVDPKIVNNWFEGK